MNIRKVLILIAGASLLGASCSYGPKAWQKTGAQPVEQASPSISPTSGPTETLDQLDTETDKVVKDVDMQLGASDQDLKDVDKDTAKF